MALPGISIGGGISIGTGISIGAGGGGGGGMWGQNYGSNAWSGKGGDGAVRIIWGAGRAFPSTNTGNL